MKASSVNRRDSSSSIPFTSWSKLSRFSTILAVGSRTGDGGGEGRAGEVGRWAILRDILSPRLAIIDLDLVIFGWGSSIVICDCVGVGSLFSSAGAGVD